MLVNMWLLRFLISHTPRVIPAAGPNSSTQRQGRPFAIGLSSTVPAKCKSLIRCGANSRQRNRHFSEEPYGKKVLARILLLPRRVKAPPAIAVRDVSRSPRQ